jgi:hypothetical protein
MSFSLIMPTTNFKLVPAEPADAQTLHEISSAAFETDAHTLMKVHEKGADGVGGELPPTDQIKAWIERTEKCTVFKAVDDTSGEVIGWAGWGMWNYDGSHPAVRASLDPVAIDDAERLPSCLKAKKTPVSRTLHLG